MKENGKNSTFNVYFPVRYTMIGSFSPIGTLSLFVVIHKKPRKKLKFKCAHIGSNYNLPSGAVLIYFEQFKLFSGRKRKTSYRMTNTRKNLIHKLASEQFFFSENPILPIYFVRDYCFECLYSQKLFFI